MEALPAEKTGPIRPERENGALPLPLARAHVVDVAEACLPRETAARARLPAEARHERGVDVAVVTQDELRAAEREPGHDEEREPDHRVLAPARTSRSLARRERPAREP